MKTNCNCEDKANKKEHPHSPSRRKALFKLGGGAIAVTLSIAFLPKFVHWIEEMERIASEPVTVDLREIKEGEIKKIIWNRKPVMIRRLNQEQIKLAQQSKPQEMLDPARFSNRINEYQNNHWLIISGICTHLGCLVKSEDDGQFRCACHGSYFDTVGRVLNGPASKNLIIPPHRFIDEYTVIIGQKQNQGNMANPNNTGT